MPERKSDKVLFQDDHLKMISSRSGQDGGLNCRVKLNQVLAIIVRKEGCQGDPGDFWMYENGYLLFQVSDISRISLVVQIHL